jgi:hypothetical protein
MPVPKLRAQLPDVPSTVGRICGVPLPDGAALAECASQASVARTIAVIL